MSDSAPSSVPSSSIPDARPGNWVERYLPPAFQPYAQLARLDRPIGWWLLLLPCWWSLALASDAAGKAFPPILSAVLLFVGAVAMRGAGCTYNDIVDRKIDAAVARTRARPIPSGRVSPRQAAVFLAAQCLVGLAVVLCFNRFAIALAISSLVIVAVYPFMKRVTGYPQAVLGLCFSWGALMGWATLWGRLELAPVALYVGTVFWTIGYDTIYAHQDREDDALVGLGSTALTFAENTPTLLTVVYAVTTVATALAYAAAGVGIAACLGLAGFGLLLFRQIVRFDRDDGDLCLRLFRSNRDAGLVLLAGLLADGLLRNL